MIEKISLILHLNSKSKRYARRKSTKSSVGWTEKDEYMAIGRVWSESIYYFHMVYIFISTRYRIFSKDLKTIEFGMEELLNKKFMESV